MAAIVAAIAINASCSRCFSSKLRLLVWFLGPHPSTIAQAAPDVRKGQVAATAKNTEQISELGGSRGMTVHISFNVSVM